MLVEETTGVLYSFVDVLLRIVPRIDGHQEYEQSAVLFMYEPLSPQPIGEAEVVV